MAMKRKGTVERQRATTRAGIKRPTDTRETVEGIAAKLAASAGAVRKQAAAGAVVKLKRKDIRVAAQVFQWRNPGVVPSDDHIFDMAKSTQNTGALDPILVFPVADRYYVMDGHHRLAAYITAGWKGDIPAIVFQGSLDAAIREALRANNKNKLSMTKAERIEAAWRLVKKGKPGEWPDSISEIQELCVVGKGTVDRMRAVWTELHNGQYGDAKEIKDLSWRQAQAKRDGKQKQAFDEDSWLEKRSQNLADDIVRTKLHLSKNPEITALALTILDPGLPAALMAYWEPRRPFDPNAVDEDELDEDGKPLPF